eukprot:13182341-Ditylum_brightwellii.AAC.1
MVDTNSGFDDRDFMPFVAGVGLCDTIGGHHGIDAPNTNAVGSKAIDFIFCTPSIMDTIV